MVEVKRINFFPILMLFIGCYAGSLYAQSGNGSIKGIVIDRYDQPLAGANVVVQKTSWGDVANAKGNFEINHIPAGDYTLLVSLLGYKTGIVSNVTVESDVIVEIQVKLVEEAIEVDEVRIVGERMKQKQDDPRTSLRYMEPKSSKTLPGFAEDVLRSLQVLPGVVAMNDFSSQMVIRGSGPDQNLIVMDDIEIFNPYRLYGLISMFNPETISDITLTTGGFTAKYGDRLSAVLDVTNREGSRKEFFRGNINTSITNANLVLDGKAPFGVEGSYLFSARRTYYDLILAPIAKRTGLVSGDVAFPNFTDVQGKIVFEVVKKNKFIVNGLWSRDGVNIVTGSNRETPDSVAVSDETFHNVVGFAWHYFPNESFLSKTIVSFYKNDAKSSFDGAVLDPSVDREKLKDLPKDTIGLRLYQISMQGDYILQKTSIKQEFSYRYDDNILEAGCGVDFLKTTIGFNLELDPFLRAMAAAMGRAVIDKVEDNKKYYRTNAYVQNKFTFSKSFFFQPGVRFDYYGILKKWYLSPRINLSYALDEITTLRSAYGRYYQSPGFEKLIDQPGRFLDFSDENLKSLEASQADHYILGFDRWLTEKYRISTDFYYKHFDNLLTVKVVPGIHYETSPIPGKDFTKREGWTPPVAVMGDSATSIPINGSYGEAYGMEIMLEQRAISSESLFYGWISYALAWGNRYYRGRWLPFDFDQRHTLNIVGNYKVNTWLDVGFTWRFGSNFPYTPVQGIKPRIVLVEKADGSKVPELQIDLTGPIGKGNVVFDIDRGGEENRNSARKPLYQRLDVRATAATKFWGMDWNFYLDIINIYNHSNIIGYNYFITPEYTVDSRPTSMFPILPTFGINARF